MNEGLSGWYGLLIFFIVAGILALVLGVLGAGAIKMMVRDDYFDKK